MFVSAVDAVGWLVEDNCEVDLQYQAYACARKTMPTRLRRLAMKAIVCMLFCGYRLELYVAAGLVRHVAVHSVTLASKSSGVLPRGPDFTCHSYCDLPYFLLSQTSKDCETPTTWSTTSPATSSSPRRTFTSAKTK